VSYTLCYKEVYGRDHVATVATKVLKVTIHHVLRRQRNVDLPLGLDAETVREYTRAAESPARAAHSLVKNLWLALRVSLPHVVVVW
jgi:hypothetical protein